ncbi:NfeD family protein [uncultured Prevotella sp.]|jgi:membrane protein implicated in regulation of membrane protease activity|uniref:NfeD family protein n=1 Tax=uncultured Prevotella sp. TaxID=159272 RepID=UPI0025E1DFED|nr:NfeD family protein [uncultured Prevotella sp.]
MIEYLANNMWQVWAVVAVLGLILELSSGDFFIMCFAIGACGAAIVSPFANIYVQLAVFVVITAISIFVVRPFALRYLHKADDDRVSNVDAMIGQQGRVSETIQAGGYGRVAIGGDDWKAVSSSSDEIPVGTRVRVVKVESIIITVEPF